MTGGLTLVVGVLTGVAAFLAGQSVMGDSSLTLADPGALRAVVGSGVYLALMALLAVGLTALLRSGSAALAVLLPFILVLSFIFTGAAKGVVQYLPDRAGQLVVQQSPDGSLGPWTGLGVTALWATAAVTAGWLALRRRDA